MREISINHLLEEGFNGMQIYQIRDGIRNEIDVTPYLNIQYTWQQMEQIKLGIIQNVDISYYAMPEMPVEQMQHIREKLLIRADENELLLFPKIQIDWGKLRKLLMVIGAVAVACLVMFLSKGYVGRLFQKLDLTLSDEEITIEYAEQFDPEKYVTSYTKKQGVQLILPAGINTSELGKQTAEYKVTNGVSTITKSMTVNVVDHTPPKIMLKKAKANLKNGEPFSCLAYIDTVIDNVDGDLKQSVRCSGFNPDAMIQKVVITAEDKSGNRSKKELMVEIEQQSEENPQAESDSEEKIEELNETPVPAPQPSQRPAQVRTPEPVRYEPYDEYISYEENGGLTTCLVHHDEYGRTSRSCEWVGAWEPN